MGIPPGDRLMNERLAEAIRLYWAERGHHVETDLMNLSFDRARCLWGVRTDMINGWPRAALRDSSTALARARGSVL